MYDDDRDALAAEYVLGTLSANERDQAEAMLAIDPGFAEIVRVWERRLGELNVMVEAIEPPPDLWDKIRSEIGGTAPIAGDAAAHEADAEEPAEALLADSASLTAPEGTAPEAPAEPAPEPDFDLTPETTELPTEPAPELEPTEEPQDLDDSAAVAALASSLLPPAPEAAAAELPETVIRFPGPAAERPSEVATLQRGVRRWRGLTVAMGAIAALLAVFIAITQMAPGLLPIGRQQPRPVVAAHPAPPGSRLVAVLQHDPTTPGFLLTVDPQARTLTVRTVAATSEAGRSYELWLIANKNAAPRSLGLVGSEEFTTRPLPANVDTDTIRSASYAISLEPAGGSPSGTPTGPVLFTGKMVESLPGSPS
jgi:anti-sigma-K factor RskA